MYLGRGFMMGKPISCGHPVSHSAPVWQTDSRAGAPGVLVHPDSSASTTDGTHPPGAAGLRHGPLQTGPDPTPDAGGSHAPLW